MYCENFEPPSKKPKGENNMTKTQIREKLVNPLPPKEGESCQTCNRRSDKYSGWSNYETWAVALWIDNESSSYDYWRERAREVLKAAKVKHETYNTPREEATYRLANMIEAEVKDGAPDLGASMYGDLLNASLSMVDWQEIAGHMFDE